MMEQNAANKRLTSVPEYKWKEADLLQYTQMKKKEKDLKVKISALESKALSDKMEFDNEKQDLLKKHKEEQRKLLAEAKENNEKQANHWKNEILQLQKKIREKDMENKELRHNIQLNKSTLDNQQRMTAMRISESNLKIDDLNLSLQEISQLYKNEIGKNKYSMETIKELNITISKLTAAVEAKQSELQQLEEQHREFKQQSADLMA